MSLEGRVAFITGASGGIGAAVARSLHEAGASVGLASRRGDDLGLERGLGVVCDVRDPEAVDAAVAATVDRPVQQPAKGATASLGFDDRLAVALAFVGSGCLLVLEIVAGRLLAPTVGVSLYTWTSVIGVVLVP